MKKRLNVFAVLVLIGALVFTACRNANTGQTPVETEEEQSDTTEDGAAIVPDSSAQDMAVEVEQ